MNRRGRAVLLAAASVFFAALPVEFGSWLYRAWRLPKIENQWGALNTPDSRLGNRPMPDGRVRDVYTVNGTPAYTAEYTTTPEGWRNTCAGPGPFGEFLAFFGCSYTFGIGVDDCDTIPALVGKAMPGRRPYNFAYQGWGPQHALELADREIKDHIREKTGAAVYLFIYGHVYRAAGGLQCAGGWGRDYPCYELEAGEPRYRGSFTEAHPWRALLYRGLLATNTVAVFKPAWPLPSRSAAGVELTAALLAKTRDRVLEQFPGSRFVVVMYPVNYTLAYEEQCRRAFTEKGLDTLAFPEPLLETVPPDRRFAEGDFGHPSAESNRVFAAWLARELSPMPEAAR